MKKTIYYWSPCLAKIATIKATINSAISLAKYSKMYEIKIIDVCGEWSKHKNYLLSQNIKLVNLTFNYYNFLPKNGFIKSRISNLIIILISIIPLIFFIKNKKPDYLIIHLITSLPLVLLNLLNTKTKMILRISGFPKLNFFRKKLWLLSEKKIFKITCPTEDLKDDLLEKNIFREGKIVFLPDPVINIKEELDPGEVIMVLQGTIPNQKGVPVVQEWVGVRFLGTGLRVSELVRKSGGLLGNAFNERATITRKNKDLTFSNITISLKNALQKKSKDDIKLNSEDILTIYDNSSMVYKTSIVIDGHVLDPGVKGFKKDN